MRTKFHALECIKAKFATLKMSIKFLVSVAELTSLSLSLELSEMLVQMSIIEIFSRHLRFIGTIIK